MSDGPLRYENHALLILDQRRLPSEEVWLRCEIPEQVAEAIRTLAVRGAPAIGLAAAYGIALAPDDRDSAFDVLLDTRPTAANLRWALERARAAPDPLAFATELQAEQEAVDRRISEIGAERLASGTRVLTHCNTGALATGGYGTAAGVLKAAFHAGRLELVWATETRPLLQGARLTAWELEREGIPFRIVVDSSVGALIASGRVDAVVVGADRIAANGDVANKIGTYPIAAVAARHSVPFYVAAPVSTIDPQTPDGAAIPIEERDPAEVASGAAALNLAFDVTPAELVTAILTERGALEPPFAERIAAL
ncbi:MAG: S-methyl-5-thioribose-1-phosphate isomerase [Solirubrobacterales bacterium]